MDDITKTPPPHDEEENPRVAYEHGDADVFTVSKYAIALGFGILIAASAMWGLFSWFESRQNEEQTKLPTSVLESRKNQLPPEPRLQATPKLDLKEFQQSEEEALKSYHWMDATHTTARIPIDDAIVMMGKRGFPSRPIKAGDYGLDQDGYRLLPEKSSSGRTFEKIAQ